MFAQLEEGEAAVIEAATHAQPVTLAVESHQWRQHQVERPGRNALPVVDDRLGDAKFISDHAAMRFVAHKPEFAAVEWREYRQVDFFSQRPGALNQWCQIHFGIDGQIGGDALESGDCLLINELYTEMENS